MSDTTPATPAPVVAVEPLSDEEIAELRDAHPRTMDQDEYEYNPEFDVGPYCPECGDWPCERARLLATLDAATARADQAERERDAEREAKKLWQEGMSLAQWKQYQAEAELAVERAARETERANGRRLLPWAIDSVESGHRRHRDTTQAETWRTCEHSWCRRFAAVLAETEPQQEDG